MAQTAALTYFLFDNFFNRVWPEKITFNDLSGKKFHQFYVLPIVWDFDQFFNNFLDGDFDLCS